MSIAIVTAALSIVAAIALPVVAAIQHDNRLAAKRAVKASSPL